MIEALAGIDIDALIKAFLLIVATISTITAALSKDKETKATAEKDDTQKFFDPSDTSVMVPPVGTPERSWKMAESTKGFLLAGHTAEEKADILEQVSAAETAGLVDYKISHPNGYYIISYGQISGGATWGK